MKIQILGTGCPKCKKLFDNAAAAIKESGVKCDLEKVEDIDKITDMGVMMTPALAIDDEVKVVGKVLDVAAIKALLEGK